MALLSRDLVERLAQLQSEIDRVLADVEANEPPAAPEVEAHTDVLQVGTDVVLRVELPGMTAEQIDVWLHRDVLVVEGEKKRPPRSGVRRFHAAERPFGAFRRVVDMPCAVDTGRARAVYALGVLEVRLPVIEERRGGRRRLPIEG